MIIPAVYGLSPEKIYEFVRKSHKPENMGEVIHVSNEKVQDELSIVIGLSATGMITDARKSVLRIRGFAQWNGQFLRESPYVNAR
ncbi:hypothetical protein Pcaca05_00010 [Pectobacterium carotovorum subsp. carotovorum]|nr:hypothetical protein Pcaca05_00010 [Pectobacterium carotovorum subsp. carotovorum]